jgi:hypothetical protein
MSGFFGVESGDSGPEYDPWTSGSEFPEYQDPNDPCAYDCEPGLPPDCPTPSAFAAEMESEIASALANVCPQGLGTSSSKACIDLWIAECIVHVAGSSIASKGDCRSDDPNATLERSRAQFVVDLTTGSVDYAGVNQSCWANTAIFSGCVPPLDLRHSSSQTYPLTNHYSVAHQSGTGTIVTITLIHSLLNAGIVPIQPQVNMSIIFRRSADGSYDVVKTGDGFPSIGIRRGTGSGDWEKVGAIFNEGSWKKMMAPALNVTCVGSLPPA